MLCLVITDPYDYERILSTFIQKAREKGRAVNIVFYIPTDALHAFVEELGEKGWLGSSPVKALEQSMLEGLKALGQSVLEHAREEADRLQVKLYTDLLLGVEEDLYAHLKQRGCEEILLKHSQWLSSEET